MRISYQALALALAAAVATDGAFAQDVTSTTSSAGQAALPDTAAGPAPSTEAVPPEQVDDGSLNEIIVTARRRNESIQTTPIAVTAIAPSQLEASVATKISDLQGLAPNVLITQQSTGAATANISIRGIAFADVEKSFDPAVGVNVDGVYIGTSTGQLLDFFDIGSIEILRGPQGTLFGRNTIAGVINVRRTRPTGEWGGKFEASIGRFGAIGLRGVLNVPVIEDVLAAKFFEFHQQEDGFLKAAGTGETLGRSNAENFGVSLLFTPSSAFDALLTLEQQEQSFETFNGSLSRTGDVFCDFGLLPTGACNRNNTDDIYTIFKNQENPGNYRARAATLEMNLDLDAIKLASVSSYRESDERQIADYSTAGNYIGDRAQDYYQFSQELRASGNLFQGFDYVAGLYYFESKYNLIQLTSIPAFGVINQLQDTSQKSRSMAAFFDFNWEVLPRVRLSGGGRYTKDRKININPLLADPAGNVGLRARESWSKFTPKVTIDYRPTDELMVYATWSRGYRSGGFNGRGQTFNTATIPYNPETVDSYEVGVKSEFLDRRVSLNLAGFYTDYKDIQQSTTVPLAVAPFNETLVTNAAGAKIKGLEADLTVRATSNLTIRGAAGYTDSKFQDFIIGQLVAGGVRQFDFSDVGLIYAPKLTAAISGEYKIDVGTSQLRLNAGYRYVSRYDQQIATDPATPIPATGVIPVAQNDPRLRSDKQNLLDASASIIFDMNGQGAKARLTAYARNILNDRGTQTAFNVAAYPILWSFAAAREPRTYGLQLGFEF
ncbi:TonB-dependent receptor [Sphingomonas sp. 1P06PA]|uniref:TonB-dependent receptor n=1 Tax=Sphingomonas sp. 1P06PA TaxID=554121 RepID=UPI0039A77991